VRSLLQDEPASSGPQRGLEGREPGRRGSRLRCAGAPHDIRQLRRPVPVILRLAVTQEALEVELTNPVEAGVAAGTSRGLDGMRERVEALRGVMSAEPRGGQFRVAVRLPLRKPL